MSVRLPPYKDDHGPSAGPRLADGSGCGGARHRGVGGATCPRDRRVTAQIVSQQTSLPRLTMAVNPWRVAGQGALVVTGLLLLLFFYRRRLYILFWTGGWLLLSASMFLAGRAVRPSSTLSCCRTASRSSSAILSALFFVISADAYPTRPKMRRGYALDPRRRAALVRARAAGARRLGRLRARPRPDCRRARRGRRRPPDPAAPGPHARRRGRRRRAAAHCRRRTSGSCCASTRPALPARRARWSSASSSTSSPRSACS